MKEEPAIIGTGAGAVGVGVGESRLVREPSLLEALVLLVAELVVEHMAPKKYLYTYFKISIQKGD